MTINYYLIGRKDRKDRKQIFLYIRLNKQTLRAYTGEKILPEQWDIKMGRPKPDTPGDETLTDLLDLWEAEIKDISRQQRIKKQPLSLELFKENLPFKTKQDHSFFGLWEKYVQEKADMHTSGTLRRYNVCLRSLRIIDGSHYGLNDKKLKSFDKARQFVNRYGTYKIEFTSINKQFVNHFIKFHKYMGFTNSFCDKNLGVVKAFMNWALDNDYITDDRFRRLKTGLKKLDKKANIYFLLEEELHHLTHMKIEDPKLDRVRDIFCFGCYTGLRYSDIENFKKSNIHGDQYIITTIKTGKTLSNRLYPPALKILDKYKDNELPNALPVISNQKMNDYLKELGPIAGLDREITYIHQSGGKVSETYLPLYEKLSTHVARKTFITYLINSGESKEVVAAITGQGLDVIEVYWVLLNRTKQEADKRIAKKLDELENGNMKIVS